MKQLLTILLLAAATVQGQTNSTTLLRSQNDSILIVLDEYKKTIDSLHERTQYADKVFQSLRDNGHFYKRKMYYRAIKDFKKRYGCGSGMKPAHYTTLIECKN